MGSSYDGVGVNDSILSARMAVGLVPLLDKNYNLGMSQSVITEDAKMVLDRFKPPLFTITINLMCFTEETSNSKSGSQVD